MPLELHTNPAQRWDAGDWFTSSTSPNLTAGTQTIASAGAGNYHYLSYFTCASPSAQVISLQDGAGAIIGKFNIEAAKTFELVLPRGMERRCPNVGQRIDVISDTSATTYWTIGGFYKPFIQP